MTLGDNDLKESLTHHNKGGKILLKRRILPKQTVEIPKQSLGLETSGTSEVPEKEVDCPICREKLEADDLVRLFCYHAFHYDCILEWYKISKNRSDTLRTCPSCRKYGGHLPLKFGKTPILHIHYIAEVNKDEHNLSTYTPPTPTGPSYNYSCIATIKSKSSPQYGKACGNFASYGGKYCGIHKCQYIEKEAQVAIPIS